MKFFEESSHILQMSPKANIQLWLYFANFFNFGTTFAH